MITSAFLLAMQMIQTLPPPTAEPTSATEWNCGFDQADGEHFWLKGTFPAVAAGWDPNAAMPAAIEGTGPKAMVGKVEMKPFTANETYRRYYVLARIPEGGHYNLMFLFLAGDAGMATIERYTPDPATGRGTIRAVATGHCESTFLPLVDEGAGE